MSFPRSFLREHKVFCPSAFRRDHGTKPQNLLPFKTFSLDAVLPQVFYLAKDRKIIRPDMKQAWDSMLDLLVYCLVLALYILFCCNTHVQWNLDITSLYITKSSDITNDFPDPSNSKVYEKEPRYSEENLSVPWPFVASRFHCNTI